MFKLFLSTFLVFTVCNALEITLPAETFAELGSTATIQCEYATTEAVIAMKWYKQSKAGDRQRLMVITGLGTDDVATNADGGYTGRPVSSDGQGSLIIADVTAEDNDEFANIFCVVEAGDESGAPTETEKSTAFTVVVYPTTDPEVSLDKTEFNMGESIKLGSCTSGEGHPKPSVSFLKNGIDAVPKDTDIFAEFTNDDIASKGSDGFSLKMKTSLVVPELTKEDDGAVFSCVVEVNGRETRTDFPAIRVNYPTDTVTVSASANPVKDGEKITLSCAANGYPAPAITDFGDGSAAELEFTASPDLAGSAVTCYAANTGNIDPVASAPFVIDVHYVGTPSASGEAVAALGSEIAPACTVDATAPGAATAWSKDGEAVVFPMTATFASTGTYTCTASADGLPSTTAEYSVEVQGLAMATVGGDVVVTDKAATLTCSAQAVPTATFSWSMTDKEGTVQTLTDGIEDSADGNTLTSTLTLSEVNSELSEATLICTATNAVGTGSAVFQMPEIATGGATGIIIGILIGLLVLAIVLYILYSRGIICKDDEKEGVEDAKDDIEAAPEKEGAPEGEQAEQTEEGDKLLSENGDGAKA